MKFSEAIHISKQTKYIATIKSFINCNDSHESLTNSLNF